MADIKIEDLMRSIRERAREGAARDTDPSVLLHSSAEKPLGRLQTSLTITERTRDQLPQNLVTPVRARIFHPRRLTISLIHIGANGDVHPLETG